MRKEDEERMTESVRRVTAEMRLREIEEMGRGLDFLQSDAARSGEPMHIDWPDWEIAAGIAAVITAPQEQPIDEITITLDVHAAEDNAGR